MTVTMSDLAQLARVINGIFERAGSDRRVELVSYGPHRASAVFNDGEMIVGPKVKAETYAHLSAFETGLRAGHNLGVKPPPGAMVKAGMARLVGHMQECPRCGRDLSLLADKCLFNESSEDATCKQCGADLHMDYEEEIAWTVTATWAA